MRDRSHCSSKKKKASFNKIKLLLKIELTNRLNLTNLAALNQDTDINTYTGQNEAWTPMMDW